MVRHACTSGSEMLLMFCFGFCVSHRFHFRRLAHSPQSKNTAKMTILPKDVKFIHDLLEPDSSQAWRVLMFNVPQASRLKKLDKSLAAKILAAGVRFEGEG